MPVIHRNEIYDVTKVNTLSGDGLKRQLVVDFNRDGDCIDFQLRDGSTASFAALLKRYADENNQDVAEIQNIFESDYEAGFVIIVTVLTEYYFKPHGLEDQVMILRALGYMQQHALHNTLGSIIASRSKASQFNPTFDPFVECDYLASPTTTRVLYKYDPENCELVVVDTAEFKSKQQNRFDTSFERFFPKKVESEADDFFIRGDAIIRASLKDDNEVAVEDVKLDIRDESISGGLVEEPLLVQITLRVFDGVFKAVLNDLDSSSDYYRSLEQAFKVCRANIANTSWKFSQRKDFNTVAYTQAICRQLQPSMQIASNDPSLTRRIKRAVSRFIVNLGFTLGTLGLGIISSGIISRGKCFFPLFRGTESQERLRLASLTLESRLRAHSKELCKRSMRNKNKRQILVR